MTSSTIYRGWHHIMVATLLAVSLGCGSHAPNAQPTSPELRDGKLTPPRMPAYITGVITAVQAGDSIRRAPSTSSPDGSVSCPPNCASGTPLRYVLVEEQPGQQSGNKVRATVLVGARLYVDMGDRAREASFDELRPGQQVQTWMDGPVAESYPEQGTAATIVIRQS